ncbi:hypothetical protein DTS51_14095 [Salmonella enterica]|nr:hypothetical protein [Salmonella enterica]ECT1267583.1 hypothetical protein [Salmonella enterica]EDO5170096.1 hypothetical protein [Salmonella enterica subsp. enterica serovar Infantis]
MDASDADDEAAVALAAAVLADVAAFVSDVFAAAADAAAAFSDAAAAVADLYALCWQSGEVVTYTPDPEKATIWLNNYSGTCVQEYVKLERLQEALSGYSPVIPRVYLADINTDHQH